MARWLHELYTNGVTVGAGLSCMVKGRYEERMCCCEKVYAFAARLAAALFKVHGGSGRTGLQ